VGSPLLAESSTGAGGSRPGRVRRRRYVRGVGRAAVDRGGGGWRIRGWRL